MSSPSQLELTFGSTLIGLLVSGAYVLFTIYSLNLSLNVRYIDCMVLHWARREYDVGLEVEQLVDQFRPFYVLV